MLPRKHKPKNHLIGTKEALDESGMCLCFMFSYPVGYVSFLSVHLSNAVDMH